jgi:EmrB/QacA subfamily drug resistance transporter
MLGVTCLSVIVVNLDLTILNIALPDISAALHAGTGDLQWLVDAYSLVFAGVMLPAGMAGDRLGRKRVLLAGLAIFLAASVWCALSGSAGELIAARALMGLGAGIVFPLSLAVVSAAFGDDDRPMAISVLTGAIALALPLGPVLGGLLLQHFSWHAVFWINVPAACLTLVAGAALMPESRNPAAGPVDVVGAVLAPAALTCLVWGFISGPEHGWTAPATLLLLGGSAALLSGFLARPGGSVVDPALFRDRRFSWGTVATIAVSVALYGILFVIPQYLQSVLGDGPASAGLRLLPLMGGLLIAGGVAGQVVQAAGTRAAVAVGLIVLAGGLAVLSQVHLGTGYGVVATGLALCGLGTGAAIGAAMSAVMAAAGEDEAGVGASVNSALRQASGAIAVAVLGSVLSATYARDLHASLPAFAGLPASQAAAARASVNQAVQLAGRLPAGGSALRTAAGTAFLHGMSTVMLICALVAVAAAGTSLRYLPGRAGPLVPGARG